MLEDDEEGGSSLFGNYSWYQMGRASAESDARTRQLLRARFSPPKPQIDVDALIAQNNALRQNYAQLHQDYQKLYGLYEQDQRQKSALQKELKEAKEFGESALKGYRDRGDDITDISNTLMYAVKYLCDKGYRVKDLPFKIPLWLYQMYENRNN
ncbi:hypothetical protein [Beijerinckia indica]|uniref:Uncharacterized protein n=1 Tax=Beijerinckia indica subsp. indica (strain ATCC 9039 / DSM 1715 / NCIMB 8712) TaxID=395963 RepID=B2ILI2_BEII9|nr:hypothetical protein [Beijerinckia indica]ACB97382.1 hypothetical protein Bind_3853 [Beijerinckia indica subsp. indica ATCC 9039]